MSKKKGKQGSAFSRPVKISTKLEKVIGKGPMPRSNVAKKIWAYIKRNDLQHPKLRSFIEVDDKLSMVLKPSKAVIIVRGKKIKTPAGGYIHMMEMTGQLNKHIESAKVKVNPRYEEEEEEEELDYDDEDQEEEEEDDDDADDEDYDDDEDEEEYDD